MAERFVVGTAGHVDHGKTALVKALTGTDCDRLPEEKARGITIELGFAEWPLGDGVRASVVDVPGHERFVHTMVSGAAGIDRVLLVIAADDGVMPQTREHVAICQLLGVAGGVVAITKCDLVDADMLELVHDDARRALLGTSLEGAEIVPCSVREPRGLEELAKAMLRTKPPARAARDDVPSHAPFLAVDRVFHRSGAGTVVTGTLVRGGLRVGDDLEALPTAEGGVARVKVRGLHVHGEPVTSVHAPARVAVNVRGDGGGTLVRGTALARPGWQVPTSSIVAELSLLPDAKPLGKRSQLVMHLGTTHRAASVTLLGAERLRPGEVGRVRLSLAAPIVTFAGQRLVLRRPDLDAHRTIGGGLVTDPHPTRRRTIAASGLTPKDRARARLDEARHAGATTAALALRLPPDDDVVGALRSLVAERAIVRLPGGDEPVYALRRYVDETKRAVLATMRGYHAEHPLLGGASASELESRQPPPLRGLVAAALVELLASRELVHDGALVRSKDHDPRASTLGADVLARYARAGMTPPLDEEVRAALSLDPRVFRDALAELKRAGSLRLLGGMHFEATALAELKRAVSAYFRTKKELAPPDLKALCGLTRKHAIPLLEWLDAEGVTRRSADTRVKGPRAAE